MKSSDDIFRENVLKHGRLLISNFAILVKLTGFYDSMNEAILNSANKVMAELESISGGRESEFALKMADETFFIEDIRIKTTVADIDNFTALARDLDERKIGVVTFKTPIAAADLVYLAYAIKGGSEATEIQSSLESRLTKGISVGGPLIVQREDIADLKDTRVLAQRAYTKSITAYIEIENAVKSGKNFSIKKAKRTLQSLVGTIMKDESYVLGLTTIRDAKNYYQLHPVNVVILSMVLGLRVGLSRNELMRLGIAALFHDIGKINIPESILNKETDYTPQEIELYRMHPIEGVKHIRKVWGLNDMSILSMLTSFEHHLNIDLTGYPNVFKNTKPNLYSRIIKIADDYDILVSGRIFRRTAVKPEIALTKMYEKSGTFYDGTLIKAFIDIFSRHKTAY